MEKRGTVKSGFRRFLKVIATIILILAVIALILHLTASEYYPKTDIELNIQGTAADTLNSGENLNIMSWNIGYGALGDNADFFMDGGESVNTASLERVNENMTGILSEITSEHPDILFLQEVDRSSTRSHRVNELQMLSQQLSEDEYSFASNFKVSYIPYPIPPIGKVDSGIATFSAYHASLSTRVPLTCPFSWPIRIANLKRCLDVTRIPVDNSDSELVIVNLHLEAFDDGEGKEKQTQELFSILEEEYKNGNYVIAGGDFNQTFSSTDISSFKTIDGTWQPGAIDVSAYSSDFSFYMDNSVPSGRSLDQAYENADTENFQYYVIDGFIVSKNIEVNDFHAVDLQFKNSDHNPVIMNVTLIQ